MVDAGDNSGQSRKRRSLGGLLLDSALVVLLGLTVATFFADQAWLPDMLSFFRPELAYASAALLLLALVARRLPRLFFAALLAGLNAWPLFVTGVPLAAEAPAPGPTVRVMSANLLGSVVDEVAFRRALAVVKPDILVVQEASPEWQKVLRTLTELPHSAASLMRISTEVDVLSRYPLGAAPLPEVPYRRGQAGGGLPLRVTLRPDPFKGRVLVLYAIHAPTPRREAGWLARNRYLESVAQHVGREPADALVVVAGDWNTPSWSPYFRKTLVGAHLFAAERSDWPQPTRVFQEFGAPVWLGTPIDHIAVSAALDVAAIGRGPRTSSDHLPVFADIGLR